MAIAEGQAARRQPLEYYPSPNAVPFDVRTPRNGTTIAAGADWTRLAAFTVPTGAQGIFNGFGQGVSTIADWSNVQWSVRINGASIPGYGEIDDQISWITRPVWVVRAVQDGDLIELLCRSMSTAAATVYGRITGWYFLP